ncbi:MAG: AzlD family protein [Halobacteriota archaeon]|uniref:AzlD family protein n=1 Tax=Natronomonas sp. TaxID=2184060 RepID=UPI0039753B4B
MIELDGLVVAVILGMGVVTYATKAGGLWLLGIIDVRERTEVALEALPGAIIVAIVAPELAAGGPAEWTAGAVAAVVAVRTKNLLVALGAAIGVVVLLRGF